MPTQAEGQRASPTRSWRRRSAARRSSPSPTTPTSGSSTTSAARSMTESLFGLARERAPEPARGEARRRDEGALRLGPPLRLHHVRPGPAPRAADEVTAVLDAKMRGAIRGAVSNSPQLSQTLVERALAAPSIDARAQGEGRAPARARRAGRTRWRARRASARASRSTPSTAATSCACKVKGVDAEKLRVHLLDRHARGSSRRADRHPRRVLVPRGRAGRAALRGAPPGHPGAPRGRLAPLAAAGRATPTSRPPRSGRLPVGGSSFTRCRSSLAGWPAACSTPRTRFSTRCARSRRGRRASRRGAASGARSRRRRCRVARNQWASVKPVSTRGTTTPAGRLFAATRRIAPSSGVSAGETSAAKRELDLERRRRGRRSSSASFAAKSSQLSPGSRRASMPGTGFGGHHVGALAARERGDRHRVAHQRRASGRPGSACGRPGRARARRAGGVAGAVLGRSQRRQRREHPRHPGTTSVSKRERRDALERGHQAGHGRVAVPRRRGRARRARRARPSTASSR